MSCPEPGQLISASSCRDCPSSNPTHSHRKLIGLGGRHGYRYQCPGRTASLSIQACAGKNTGLQYSGRKQCLQPQKACKPLPTSFFFSGEAGDSNGLDHSHTLLLRLATPFLLTAPCGGTGKGKTKPKTRPAQSLVCLRKICCTRLMRFTNKLLASNCTTTWSDKEMLQQL